MMKTKQSIVGTFFLNIAIVLFSTLVITLAMWIYELLQNIENHASFADFVASLKSLEFIFIFLFVMLTTFVVSRMLARDLKKHFTHFKSYFNDASKNLNKIDIANVHFKEFEDLAHSVNLMVDDVQASKKEALLHKSYLQAVLEVQRNIVFVMSSSYIVSANRAFLTFFQIESIQEFYSRCDNFCDIFVDDNEGYMQCTMGDVYWNDFVIQNPTLIHKVKLLKDDEVYIFIIDIAQIDSEDDEFVVSLTDITQVENERRLFEKAASTDALTGIANRLKFNTILEQQIALTKRHKEVFSLILFDIDDFKRVNDTYGHKMGDDVLVSLTKNVSSIIRESDTFARWGGEEFGIILPQTEKEKAYMLANKIRQHIETLRFGEGFKLTCSFGVGEYDSDVSSDYFIQSIDVLLYQAKRSGKNRVIMMDERF